MKGHKGRLGVWPSKYRHVHLTADAVFTGEPDMSDVVVHTHGYRVTVRPKPGHVVRFGGLDLSQSRVEEEQT